MNNGVIVHLAGNTVWTVTGVSYITRLDVAQGTGLAAPEGKTLRMTVNGEDVAPAAGSYAGLICLQAE